MTTLIDTSAWIEFFRGKGHPDFKTLVADLVFAGDAAYTCPVRFELFHGARKEELPDLTRGLGYATRVEATPAHWDGASALASRLKAKGFNFPALDLLIATVACDGDFPLLSRDGHFTTIRNQALPRLRLISPS